MMNHHVIISMGGLTRMAHPESSSDHLFVPLANTVNTCSYYCIVHGAFVWSQAPMVQSMDYGRA